MTAASLDIRPLCAAGGAEIYGVDLSKELTNEQAEAIHRVFLDHVAIWFPEQQLSPADLTRLIYLFGQPFVHPYLKALEGYPYVHELRKTPEQTVNFGRGWHADWTFLEKPSLANALYSRIVPDSGGDTMFVNTYRAYEALSDGMKRMLGGMRAVHKVHPRYFTDVDAMGNKKASVVDQEITHPVVRTHPETGRKALYINPSFVKRFEDMTEEESAGILDFINEHLNCPEFQFRYRWKPDTLGIWDNRCSLHYALNDYTGQLRLMHRLSTSEPSRPV